MKSKLVFLLLLVLFVRVKGQTGFKVYLLKESKTVSPNAVIQKTVDAQDAIRTTFDIHNISSTDKYYHVKRYDQMLHDQALANFCFGGVCYVSAFTTSPYALKLNPNQRAHEIVMGVSLDLKDTTTATLDADLTEYAQVNGPSIVKYTVYDTVNVADSLQFTMSYNSVVVGLNDVSDQNVWSVDIYPNPTSNNVAIKISSKAEGNVVMNIHSFVGELVYTGNITLKSGENEIKFDVKNYSSGLYFISIPSGNVVLSKKLLVN